MSQEMDIGQKKSKQKGAAKTVMQRKTTDVPGCSDEAAGKFFHLCVLNKDCVKDFHKKVTSF